MCNVIGCANFDNPPLCIECQWNAYQKTARIAELEARINTAINDYEIAERTGPNNLTTNTDARKILERIKTTEI